MNMRIELLETLIRQCVREVLDQIEEEANVSTIKSSGIGKADGKEPATQKIPVKFAKGKKTKVNIKKINEAEGDQDDPTKDPDDPTKDPNAPPTAEPAPSPTAAPAEPPPTAAPAAEKPSEPAEPPPPSQKGALVVNPKDKSKLQPIQWQGRDEASIERVLHHIAATTAGNRTKVSLSAKRLARELMNSPGATAYFYFGKMDPESDEIFLLADKSIQIAKDDSVQPSEITGRPAISPLSNYKTHAWDEPSHEINPDNKYAGWMSRGKITPTAKPRYGIDEPELNESVAKMIKKLVNHILDK